MKKVEKNKFNLEECCVMWKNTSKGGTEYLKGNDLINNKKVVGFINTDGNDKLPKIKIYNMDNEGNMKNELIVLWETKSKEGNLYLSGYTDEKENVIAFYGDGKNENTPFIKVYFKEK